MGKAKKDEEPVRIINQLSDGTIVGDMTGRVIPYAGRTKTYYTIIREVALEQIRREQYPT